MQKFYSLEECKEMKLLGSNVLVRRYRPPMKLTPDSLIVLPRDFMEFKLPGVGMSSPNDNPRLEVINVGPGELFPDGTVESVDVKVGDIVIADSMVTDERNKIGVGDDETDGIYSCHVKLLETVVVEEYE